VAEAADFQEAVGADEVVAGAEAVGADEVVAGAEEEDVEKAQSSTSIGTMDASLLRKLAMKI